MPRLITFLVARRAIVDQGAGNVSAIDLLSGFSINPMEQPDVPGDNAAIYFPWGAVAYWKKGDGDEGKVFEQGIELISPTGRNFGKAVGVFDFGDHPFFAMRSAGEGLFVGYEGEYQFRLSLRDITEADWKVVGDYSYFVTHTKPEPVAEP